MVAQMLQYLSGGIFVVSVGYLVWRTVKQVRVQGESYRVLPFGRLVLEDAADGEMLDRGRGGLLGVALGDALGMPRESLPVWLVNLRYGKKAGLSRGIFRFMRRRGTVTDDTQLTYAVARSIGDDGKYEGEVFEGLLVGWIRGAIGPGRATMEAARGLRDGVDRRDFGSEGNGAMMRVFPFVIAMADVDEMLEAVYRNAEVTHPHGEAIAGAEAVARLGAWLFAGPVDRVIVGEELVDVALPRTVSNECLDWERRLGVAVVLADKEGGVRVIGASGWVKHTVPSLVYLLVRYGADVEDGFREIWAAGGDVDTLAAMYLGCVGLWKGAGVFDGALLGALQGAAALNEEATRLLRVRGMGGEGVVWCAY